MIAACMLFDSMYSVEGWLCYKSIRNLDPCMKVYVLCLDQRVFREACYWQHYNGDIIPVQLYDLENHFKELLGARLTRPWNAYTQTCKVFLPSYIFEKYDEESVYYIDSDLYFWSSSSQIENVLGEHSFLVSSREQEPPPRQGRFNGGFYACRNDKCTRVFLKWWQEKTIEWCLWGPGTDGKFGEEGYLNIFHDHPDKFQGILVSPHPGINLAYWNMHKHDLIIDDGIVIDGSYPLICFHYQGMEIKENCYEACVEFKNNVVKHIYDTYYEEYLSFKEEFTNGMESYRWR
jgi:hypothetical protein